jgi:hypothetical protein
VAFLTLLACVVRPLWPSGPAETDGARKMGTRGKRPALPHFACSSSSVEEDKALRFFALFSLAPDLDRGSTTAEEPRRNSLLSQGDHSSPAALPARKVRESQARGSDFFNWGWLEALDSTLIFRAFYHSGAPYAAPGVANPELDASIDAAEAEPSTYVRDELVERLWKRVLGDILYVPLYRIVNAWVIRTPLDLPMGVNLFPQFRFARVHDLPP